MLAKTLSSQMPSFIPGIFQRLPGSTAVHDENYTEWLRHEASQAMRAKHEFPFLQ